MTPFLEAGDPSWVTWAHVWAAMVVLNLYIGAGVWWAFRIQRERDARLGLARAVEHDAHRPRRSLEQFLDEVYGVSALRLRAARALAVLRSRAPASVAARRPLAEDERAPAA